MSKQMLDWGKLVSQGRAKAHGVSWSDKESAAVALLSQTFKVKMSEVAPYVRKGILTVDAYSKAKGSSGIINPYLKLDKEVLLKKVIALKISVAPDSTKEVLAQILLQEKQKQQAATKAKRDKELAEKKAVKAVADKKAKAEKEAKEKKAAEEKVAKEKSEAEANEKKEGEAKDAKRKAEKEKKAKEEKGK